MPEREMTVGIVQKEIRIGLLAADVAEALGSPSIVTNDGFGKRDVGLRQDRERRVVFDRSNYRTVLLTSRGDASGTTSTSQRTLTVVIKFDRQNRVESFPYHTSKFKLAVDQEKGQP